LNSVFVLEKWIGGTPLEHPPYNPDFPPCHANTGNPFRNGYQVGKT
jgi:hypothetical protein